MNLLKTQNRIIELMARFVTQVKGSKAMNKTDLNRAAETVLIPLLSEVFDLKNLKNLNSSQSQNYPAIDLADKQARIAFQVTATPDSDKVKYTLQKFVEHEFQNQYDRLVIYILTEKQKSYSGSGFDHIVGDQHYFNKDRDICDFSDLLAEIGTFQIAKAKRVENILEANFGEGCPPLFENTEEPRLEKVTLNLLRVSLPKILYVADIDLAREGTVKPPKSLSKRYGVRNTRDCVRMSLQDHGLAFGTDWICHANQIVTFHNLKDNSLPLAQVIDYATITPITPEEFYEQSEDQDRVFKSLLWRCLQQKLYQQHIQWQNEDRLFIFSEVDNEPVRKEQWFGKKRNERTVYERVMKKNKPDEVFFCKHLAFSTQFVRFAGEWYIVIKPDWFFSYDGYYRSAYGAKKIDYLKKNEWNAHVFNHVRFIAHILQHDPLSTLFQRSVRYPFLSFGELLQFDTAPALNDKEWLQGESKATRRKFQDSENSASLTLNL